MKMPCLCTAILCALLPAAAQLEVECLDSRPTKGSVKNSPIIYWLETNVFARPLRVHALVVNLKHPAVELDVIATSGTGGQGPAHALLDDPSNMLKDSGALAAVNANACIPAEFRERAETNILWRRRMPVSVLGWAQDSNGLISPPKTSHPAFWMDAAGHGRIGNLLHPVSATMAVAGTARLLIENDSIADSDPTQKARTGLGINAEGSWLMLAVAEESKSGRSEGITPRELAGFLRDFGCNNAIELDGGAAAAMFLKKGETYKMLNKSSGSSTRPLPLLLVVRQRQTKQSPQKSNFIRP